MKTVFVLILCLLVRQGFSQSCREAGNNDTGRQQLLNRRTGGKECSSLVKSFSGNNMQRAKVNMPVDIKRFTCPAPVPGSGLIFPDTNYILTNIVVDRSPQQVVIPPNSHKAFVLCQGTGVIKVINLDSAAIENTIELNSFAVNMTMNSDGSKIFIANLAGQAPSGYPSDDCGSTGFGMSQSPVIVFNTQTQSIDTSFNNIILNRTIVLNDDETVMYVIGAQDYITAYDMNTYSLLHTYNISSMSGHSCQPLSAALADAAHKLFIRSMVFNSSGVIGQVQILDLAGNTVRAFSFDTLGYSSNSFYLSPVILSPDKQDVYVDAGSSQSPPNTCATFIYDVTTEALKKIAFNLSTEGKYILYSDSTAFYDDNWLFGNKRLFNFTNYNLFQDMNAGGCSGIVSPDRQTLYLTQIGAHHDEGVTYGSPQQYDITFLDIATGALNEIFISPDMFTCSFERMIAMTTDGNFLITTNSALNTVSVLKFFYPVNLQEKNRSYEFKIIPNPNSGKFNLVMNYAQNDIVTMRIFNTQGEIVFQRKEKVMNGEKVEKISLASPSAGLYYLVITGTNFNQSSKILVQ